MNFRLIPKMLPKWFVLKPVMIIFVFLIIDPSIYAQNKPDTLFRPNLQVGVSAGTSLFFGDIKQNNFWPLNNNNNEWRYAYGLNFNYSFSPVFMFRVAGLYGELSGTKRSRHIWFENDYYEINFNTVVNLNNLFGRNREDRLVNLFGTAGFGIINFNSVVKRMGEYYVLKRVGYGYGTGFEGRDRQSFFMVGVGVNFRVNKRFDIIVETTNKYAFTDLLDGTESGKYNDVYNYTSIGIVYRFAFLKKSRNKSSNRKRKQAISIQSMNAQAMAVRSNRTIYTPIIKYLKVDIPSVRIEPEETYSTIEFRVQVMAEYGKPYSKKAISEKYNIPVSEISENKVNRYYVYTVGSFPNYSLAKIKCNELQSEHGIDRAFVVAFKDGKRIFPVKK